MSILFSLLVSLSLAVAGPPAKDKKDENAKLKPKLSLLLDEAAKVAVPPDDCDCHREFGVVPKSAITTTDEAALGFVVGSTVVSVTDAMAEKLGKLQVDKDADDSTGVTIAKGVADNLANTRKHALKSDSHVGVGLDHHRIQVQAGVSF